MRFLLGFALAAAAFAQAGKPGVTLVTSDIENFWKAYDANQPGNREEAFQKLYLDAGSVRRSAGIKKGQIAETICPNQTNCYAIS